MTLSTPFIYIWLFISVISYMKEFISKPGDLLEDIWSDKDVLPLPILG